MSAPQLDDEVMQDLKRDLQAIDALYPDDIEPPASADDAVRAAARRAVRAKPRGESFWWPNTPPLAAAAVLVLTVSIAFLAMDDPIVQELQREPDVPAARVEVVPAPSPVTAAPAPEAPARIAAPAPAAQAARPVADAAKSTSGKERQAVERAPREETRAQSASATRPPSPIAESAPPQVASAPVAPAYIPPPPTPAAPVALPVPAAASPATPSPPSAPAPISAARALGSNEIVLAPRDDPRLKAFAKKETYIAQPDKVAPADVAVEAKIAGSAQRSDAAREAAASPPRMTAASTAPAPVATVPVPAAPVAIQNPPAALLQDAPLMPELWLKRIQLLKSEGKLKEAEEELVKFRKRYPDYPLPEELKPKEAGPQK
ncbi:MAG: hypothetical protein SF172_12055 [Burkholderiales bacterium]|nr:hypothetical protein [Burkholderiales bacterium]